MRRRRFGAAGAGLVREDRMTLDRVWLHVALTLTIIIVLPSLALAGGTGFGDDDSLPCDLRVAVHGDGGEYGVTND